MEPAPHVLLSFHAPHVVEIPQLSSWCLKLLIGETLSIVKTGFKSCCFLALILPVKK